VTKFADQNYRWPLLQPNPLQEKAAVFPTEKTFSTPIVENLCKMLLKRKKPDAFQVTFCVLPNI
jgi:hypothetical protein